PWNEWFPPDAIPSHLPDEDLRRRFLAELPRLPIAYFAEVAPEVNDWEAMPCAYLRLSEAYDATAREAASCGWLTRHEDSDHLAMVTRPDAIATALDEILKAMGWPAGESSGPARSPRS